MLGARVRVSYDSLTGFCTNKGPCGKMRGTGCGEVSTCKMRGKVRGVTRRPTGEKIQQCNTEAYVILPVYGAT